MKKIIFVLLIAVSFTACKKSNIKTTPLTPLNITNAIVGGTTAKFGSRATTISNNNYSNFALVAGANDLYIYPNADSLHPYYNESKFNVSEGEIYSLFLTGTPAAVDAIKIKETIPFRTDSTAGIRFINLAPNTNAKPINITLATTATVNEVSALVYKNYTEFKTYPGLAASTYTFQIRNDTCASPKAPLATFSLSTSTVPRFANITVVIRQSGAGLATFRVNNDR
jgi:hypothetical protein